MVLFVGVIPHLIIWYVKTRLNYLIKERKKAILNLKTRTKAKLWSEMAILEYKIHSFCVCVWDLDFNMNKNSAGVFGSSVSAFQPSMQRHFKKKTALENVSHGKVTAMACKIVAKNFCSPFKKKCEETSGQRPVCPPPHNNTGRHQTWNTSHIHRSVFFAKKKERKMQTLACVFRCLLLTYK